MTRARSFATLVFASVVVASVIACRDDRSDTKPSKAAAIADDAGAHAPAAVAQRRAAHAANEARVPAVGFAVVTRSALVASGAVGFADDTTHATATADTVFHAASIGKLVVATCVMQLVEEQRLALDHDVSSYVGFQVRHPRFLGAPITLRMLLAHRASIRDRVDELRAARSDRPLGTFLRAYLDDATRDAAAPAFLDAAPDGATVYSNVGAALAALAVERVSGESFAQYSARRVFAPLGMTSTRWSHTTNVAAGATAVAAATPHARRGSSFASLPHTPHAVYPAADLYASAPDLARFARAVLSRGSLDGTRILSERSVTTMLGTPDADRPLAWQLRTIGTAALVGHEGEDDGTSAALFLDIAAGTGAIVLANGDAFASGDAARATAIQTLISDLLAIARSR